MSGDYGTARVEGSCVEASDLQGQSVAQKLAHSLGNGGARGTPCDPTYVHVGSLEVEPTFLARVYEATWQHADVEMQKLGRRARGSHA